MLKKLIKTCMKMDKDCGGHHGKGGSGSPLYAFGLFGSLIYFWQTSDPGFMEKVVVLVKAILWPGFLVYEVLKFIGA